MKVRSLLTAVGLSAIVASGLAFASVAQAQARWTLIPQYVDPSTGVPVTPFAINDAGATTGYIFIGTATDLEEGFLRDPNGVYSSFAVGADTEPRGIDDNDRVVGASYVGPGDDFNEFSRAADGTVNWLRNPGTGLLLDGIAQGQDSNGDIVGDYLTGSDGISGPAHGYILNGSSFTDLSFPGSADTKARGINDDGVIVGDETTGSLTSGFIDDHGVWTAYDHPGADETVFEDINNNGLIVGQWIHFGRSGPIFHNFLYNLTTDSTRELYAPDQVPFTQAFSINNRDQVLVVSVNDWIFNADAVPEPGAWAIMLIGFGALGAMTRLRRGRVTATA